MTRDRIQEAAILLTRHVGRRVELRSTITDSLAGQPKAQSYDSDGASPSPWCWAHGRPVSVCHDADLHCDGESLSSNDPTGEAATSRDPAASHLAEVERLEQRITDDVWRLAKILDYYLPSKLPDGADRAKLASAGDPGCFFCLTYGRTWSPPHTKAPTTVAGNLSQPRHVCSSCYFHIRSVGRAPSKQEVQHFVNKGRWPRQKAA